MSYSAKLNLKEGMQFEATIRDHKFQIDAKVEHGGKDTGPNPKELLLSAIMGCTAMDVASLMRKTRVEFDSFEVRGDAEPTEKGTHPIIYKKVDIIYSVKGQNVELEKVKKAVELSMTKYCGVSAMVSKAAPIFWKIEINGEIKADGEAKF